MSRSKAKKRDWSAAELATLRRRYASEPTADIARDLPGRSVNALYDMANKLGLAKNGELLAQTARQRNAAPGHGSKQHLFQPGHATWNKGLRGSTGLHPNTARNHFSKGQLSGRARQLVQPIGAYAVFDGVLVRKIGTATGPTHLRWKAVHTLLWVAAHGAVPAGHVVVFKPGRKTIEPDKITLDALDCISRAENMRRNSLHTRMPPELARLVQLRGALQRQINRRNRGTEESKDEPTRTPAPHDA